MTVLALLAVVLGPSIPMGDVRPERHRVRAPDPRIEVVAPYRSRLMRIASCESGQRWGIATGNGYYGGLQFDLSTWRSVGGQGYPHWHSRLEQLYRGALLYRIRGPAPWPVCGYR